MDETKGALGCGMDEADIWMTFIRIEAQRAGLVAPCFDVFGGGRGDAETRRRLGLSDTGRRSPAQSRRTGRQHAGFSLYRMDRVFLDACQGSRLTDGVRQGLLPLAVVGRSRSDSEISVRDPGRLVRSIPSLRRIVFAVAVRAAQHDWRG